MGIVDRQIYVFLDEKEFKPDVIPAIFEDLQKQYPTPKILQIVMYSDRDMLKKHISFDAKTTIPDFSDTPGGQKAAAEYYERNYPLASGYYRAIYDRNIKWAYYDYNPEKEKPQMVRVNLKEPEDPQPNGKP